MNFYPRWPGDYQRDTASLSLTEHGAYCVLLDYYYSAEHPLPIELEQLYRICRAMSGEEQEAVGRVVERFFPVNGTHRHNKRADRELRNSAARIQAAKDNGQRGGRPRREKPSGNPVGLQNITQREPSGFAKHNPAGTQWLTQQKVPFPPHTPPYPQTKNQNPKAKSQKPNPKDLTGTSHTGLSISSGRSRSRDPTKKNGTRLELDELPAPWVEWALCHGIADPAQCWDEFRDYWIAIPGQRGRKVDWPATWRNWVRRAAEMKGGRAPRAVDNSAASEEAKKQFHARHKPIIEAATDD